MEEEQVSAFKWRLRSWIVLVVGLFMVLFMGVVAWLTWSIRASFTGTPAQALMVVGVFGLVIAFGATCALQGWYMLANGRLNPTLNAIFIWLLVILFTVGGTALLWSYLSHFVQYFS